MIVRIVIPTTIIIIATIIIIVIVIIIVTVIIIVIVIIIVTVIIIVILMYFTLWTRLLHDRYHALAYTLHPSLLSSPDSSHSAQRIPLRNLFLGAILSLQFSGGAYLPLDVAYPSRLFHDILLDARPTYILSKRDLIANMELMQGKTTLSA